MFHLVELDVALLDVRRSSGELNSYAVMGQVETNSNNTWNYGLSLPHIIVNMYLPHLIIREIGSLNDALKARIRAYSNGGLSWPRNQSRHNKAHLQGSFCFT